MPCSQPRPLGWNFPYCNTSTQPFVIYENQAVALIAQLQSGSRAVVRQGVQTGGGTVIRAGPPTLLFVLFLIRGLLFFNSVEKE